jgi:hypothetical protein
MAFLNWLVVVLKSIFSKKEVAAPIPTPKPVQDTKPSEPSVVKSDPTKINLLDAIKVCIKPYENLREINGKNRSALIDKIITSHGGSLGSAYCCYGVQQLLDDVETYYANHGVKIHFDIPGGGSTQSLWALTKPEYKFINPKPASLVVWRHMSAPSTGHIGTCLSFADAGEFKTFEFNTSSGTASVVRDGEGAFYRTRKLKDAGDMHILGFIDLEKAMKHL